MFTQPAPAIGGKRCCTDLGGRIQAHLWFNLAAARFPAAEKEKREAATKHRDTVGAKMTREQVAEAQKLAQQWQPKPESAAGWWDWLFGIFR